MLLPVVEIVIVFVAPIVTPADIVNVSVFVEHELTQGLVGLNVQLPLIVGAVPILYARFAVIAGERVRSVNVTALPEKNVGELSDFIMKFAFVAVRVNVLRDSNVPEPVKVMSEAHKLSAAPPLADITIFERIMS